MFKMMKTKLKKAIKWYLEQCSKSYTTCPSGMLPIIKNYNEK